VRDCKSRTTVISLTGTYTGEMKVPHFAGYIENDRIETTPSFFDLNVSLAYSFSLSKSTGIKLSVGMKNILDSYQNDFDKGINRDAGYIYGPMQPRTVYLGLNLFSN
jgi:outer membrane receptor for ferrienterochelin and colicins